MAPYPELIRVRQGATAGDWVSVQAAYHALSNESLRSAAVRTVGDVKGSREMLAPVAESPGYSSEQLLARTMLASALIQIGWGIRTNSRAQYVSKDQFRQLHDYLRQAEQVLIDVIAHDPNNVAAWNERMVTARGLQLGLSEARRRYDHAARLAPHLVAPQKQMLQHLCPKWAGTLDQVHAFARECAFSAPPGSLNGQLVADGHLEHWATLSGSEARAYLGSSAVQEEVTAAAYHSVLNSAFVPVFGWVVAHAYFALLQSAAGNPAAASVHFQAVGSFDISELWSQFFDDAQSTCARHRAAALPKG
jgi:hypothetical protein